MNEKISAKELLVQIEVMHDGKTLIKHAGSLSFFVQTFSGKNPTNTTVVRFILVKNTDLNSARDCIYETGDKALGGVGVTPLYTSPPLLKKYGFGIFFKSINIEIVMRSRYLYIN